MRRGHQGGRKAVSHKKSPWFKIVKVAFCLASFKVSNWTRKSLLNRLSCIHFEVSALCQSSSWVPSWPLWCPLGHPECAVRTVGAALERPDPALSFAYRPGRCTGETLEKANPDRGNTNNVNSELFEMKTASLWQKIRGKGPMQGAQQAGKVGPGECDITQEHNGVDCILV